MRPAASNQMPEMDGFEALAAIRAAEKTDARRAPIVAVTAHAMAEDRERCLAAGLAAARPAAPVGRRPVTPRAGSPRQESV